MFHLSMRFSLTRRWSNVLFSRNDDEFHFILTLTLNDFYFWTARNSSIFAVGIRNVRLKLETSYTRINCKLKYIYAIQQMYSKMAMETIEKVHAFPFLSLYLCYLLDTTNERDTNLCEIIYRTNIFSCFLLLFSSVSSVFYFWLG